MSTVDSEARVGRLHKMGYTQIAIADRLGLGVWDVGKILDALEQQGRIPARSSRSAVRKTKQ